MAPGKVRSSSLIGGWSLWRRNTCGWWRSTMISGSFDRPERTSSRLRAVRNRYRVRNTSYHDGGIAPDQHPRMSLRAPHAAARSLLVGALAQIAKLERTR
jgi:hypothetical protein